ncbi:outer membrane protein assembly factor BamB family protein [Acanthopleuribacter pedis]|uniref:PQQ-binding-like beta-propeller repeat protein n=1 Tax=Acanthopleuribacter pedis TaxID=442870 RepID=A0A8J7U5Z2_9BACT|nr:PQQ-binding-like beta-propeller repeat protein [Acanthopleuribacter pedis]MBO1320983.1 PQQ-binding-like beta-propeller repeat protein [Acanthopleuribacter pedis]
MKYVVLILVLMVAGAAAYFFMVDPSALDRLQGKAPAAEPTTNSQPATREPTQSKPSPAKPKASKTPTFTAPDSEMAWFVNGEPVPAGGDLQVKGDHWVVTGYKDGRYSHHSVAVGADAPTISPTPKSTSASAVWEAFQGDGSRRGLVDAVDRTSLTKAWELDLADRIKASPVIYGDRFYISSNNHLLNAIDLKQGKLLWQAEGMGSTVSPVANASHVFMGNDAGLFNGYLIKNGKQKGETSLESYAVALALISEEAFLATTRDHQVLSIKTKKGFFGKLPLRVNWKVDLPELGAANATPVLVDGKAIFVTEKSGLVALDTDSGKRIWPASAAAGKADFTGDGDMSLSFVNRDFFLTPTPAAENGVIYSALGKTLVAQKVTDGTIIWKKELDNTPTSSLALANGLLYFGDNEGRLQARSLIDGAPMFAAKVSEQAIFASPALFKDKCLVGTQEGNLLLLHAFTGKQVAKSNALAGAAVKSSPAVTSNAVLAVNEKGKIVCFQ